MQLSCIGQLQFCYKYFVAKEAKVFIQWVIYKIPYNLRFWKWRSDFSFWKPTSVKFYLNILPNLNGI